jgi:hydroxypyruvate isomerase
MELTRRDALTAVGVTAVSAALLASPGAAREAAAQQMPGALPIRKPTKKRITQSVCQWCYRQIALPDFFKGVAERGLTAVDLLNEEQWKQAKEVGLQCSLAYVGAGGINEGLNDPKHHETLITAMKTGLPKLKAAGIPSAICFFGKRNGMSDADGIKNSIACLQQIKPIAEENGVNVIVELLNSKVNHPDYIGDKTPYGAEIIRAINSPNVKLLYDIYHMQIMEGDVIATINKYKDAIGHYHTGGVPGRNELDATQELNWPAVAEAIVATGYKGYFAHEFIPKRDPMTSLGEAVTLCDV